MHRPVAIAVLAAAILAPGLQAQMRSMRARVSVRGSAPAHPGVASRHVVMPTGRHFGPAVAFHGGARHGRFFSHNHRRFFFRRRCFNGFCNPGFFAGPPIFWPDWYYASSYDYGMQNYAPQQGPTVYEDSALQLQIQQLTDEIGQLREEQEARSRPLQPVPQARMDLPVILVFRDGKRREVQNYGIVGQILWVFTEQHAKKIPLADLDLVATKSINDDRGVSFVVPNQAK
jgi:hypothetical protein